MPQFEILGPRNPLFTGRAIELNAIHQYFSHPPLEDRLVPRIYPLTGPSGIGKTQIALEYAHRHRQEYHALFWVQATETFFIEKDFREILTCVAFPVNVATLRPRELIASVHSWLKNNPGWLIIFDGITSAAALTALPKEGSGNILLTVCDDVPLNAKT